MNSYRCLTSQTVASTAIGIVCALTVAACGGGSGSMSASQTDPPATIAPGTTTFTDAALVVDKAEVVATTATIDANLQNPWGIAVATGLPFWIADNNSNLTTFYSGTGAIETQAVTGSPDIGVAISPASAAGVQANPTGQVYNGKGGFLIPTSSGQESALFIFDEGGTIAAWAKDNGATAVTTYDDGVVNGPDHAVYKGLALGTVSGATYLYATDLHNNKVDVFDTNFSKPAVMQGKFIDPSIPAGFVPFGITALNGQLYVTYAKQDTEKHDDISGAGFGYVDIFDFGDCKQVCFAGALNAPWGMAIAPAGFGSLQGDVLIGNFGRRNDQHFPPEWDRVGNIGGSLDVQ